MKKSLGLFILGLALLSSCQTVTKTARTADVALQTQSATVADLEAADQRVSYTLQPSKKIRRGGLENVKQAAEAEVLREHNADVLIEPRYVVSKKRSLFGSKITSITVSGRPAYYKNYRSLNDSVWNNPVFRGVKTHYVSAPVSKAKSKPSAKSNASAYRQKGWEKYLSLMVGGGTFNFNDEEYEDWLDTESHFALSVLGNYGYRFSPYVFVGLVSGVKYQSDNSNISIPLYVNGRFNFSQKKNSYFLDYMYGVDFNLDNNEIEFGGGYAIGKQIGDYEIAIRCLMNRSIYEENADIDISKISVGLSLGYRF